MTTSLNFAIIAVPLTFSLLGLLAFGRRHIHGQMEQIAAAAEARAAARSERNLVSHAAKPSVTETTAPVATLQMHDATAQTV